MKKYSIIEIIILAKKKYLLIFELKLLLLKKIKIL